MRLYFAYGANLNFDDMQQRCPMAVPWRSFSLDNWKLAFAGVATVIPSINSRVVGMLWQITDECERRLDSFEGYPYLYHKVLIQDGTEEIMFYRKNSESLSMPTYIYLETIRQGYCHWGLDLGYLDAAVLEADEAEGSEYKSQCIMVTH